MAALLAASAEAALLLLVLSVLAAVALRCGDALSLDLYDESCPEAEAAVTAAVRQAMANDRTVAAGLLRMHFHDCFVREYARKPFDEESEQFQDKTLQLLFPNSKRLRGFFFQDKTPLEDPKKRSMVSLKKALE
ncbi:peroxidase 1-like [Miscanthus floridulus]|uniref:peroxidase 1-like n=1 Tax=Miscanthus floridulus TaxID=154761 RepID=UPI00345A0724